MMPFRVTEVFNSYQGEGRNLGVKSVFVRMAGCNYWSGDENSRSTAICQFCDTDFSPRYAFNTIEGFAAYISSFLNGASLVIITGGEPMLQISPLYLEKIQELLPPQLDYAIETNGSIDNNWPESVWVTMSPKARGRVRLGEYDELKVVLPGEWESVDQLMEEFRELPKRVKFKIIMPEDGGDIDKFWKMAHEITEMDASWRIGIQAHKFWDIK